MKGLIVTADDFGAAVEVNEAVELAYRDGILTAASLMVSAPAAQDAVARARAMPSLRVGLHLVLTDGKPTLPPQTIPNLVDRRGCFRDDMALAGAEMFLRPRVRTQLAEEIAAQFEAFAATGLRLDHVNAHKHFHLHPTIAGLIMKIGQRFGLRAARVPLEPRSLLSVVETGSPQYGLDLLAPFCELLRMRFRAADIMTPDHVFGLAWSGAMTCDRLRGLIAHLPDGISEIYLHPATRTGFQGAAPGYRYRDELEALMDATVAGAARVPSIRLGGFADFSHRR